MCRKIIAINPSTVDTAELQKLFPIRDFSWDNYKLLSTRLNFPSVRIGQNILPFETTMAEVFHDHAPRYDKNFSLTWSDITDARFYQLQQELADRPWCVMWSGGVDSTVIVTGILKNTLPSDRKNICIVCNDASVYENPLFYKNHILPNFSIMAAEDFKTNLHTAEKYYVINGNPADALFSQYSGQIQRLNLKHPGILSLDFRKHTDQVHSIIHFLHGESSTENYAQWWLSIMIHNIDSQDIPVDTIFDLFWYSAFNMSWGGTKLREHMNFYKGHDGVTVDGAIGNIFWYDSELYQLWAMTNNKFGVKYGDNLGEYKLESKKYIYDYDKDEYYLKFKQKLASTTIVDLNRTQPDSDFFCVLDDFTTLSLPHDRQHVQDLMQLFIK